MQKNIGLRTQFVRGAAAVVVSLVAACGGSSEPASVAATPLAANTAIGRSDTDTVSVSDGAGGVRLAKASANAYIQPPEAEPKKQAVDMQKRSHKPLPTLIDLGAVSEAKSLQMRKNQTSRGMGKVLQVGFARDVEQAKSSGGLVSALAFKSGGAEGMRIGIAVQSLSPEATVRFYQSGGSEAVEVSGKTINEALALNLASGDTSEDGRTYWGPFLKGENGTFEIELPAGISADAIVISAPRISHFFLDPLGKESLTDGLQKNDTVTGGLAKSGSCNLDVPCNTPLSTASKSVAKLLFNVDGGAGICTGTLLNDDDSTGTPYLLTADHCISTQTSASSLTTYWFYRSSACNSGVLNPNMQVRNGGAILLYNRNFASSQTGDNPVGTDTSFLRLKESPPAGAVFSGWSAVRQAISSKEYTALHNPGGDLQKYSLGQIKNYSFLNSGSGLYSNSEKTGFGMYLVIFSKGIVEGGSSGSGLFLDANTPNPKLVGQLYGGFVSCSNQTGSNSYGRFDIAYKDAGGLAQWLSSSAKPIYRFRITTSGSYFYSISAAEVQSIKESFPEFVLEGPAFSALPATTTAFMPVYRFRNKINGSYLWTISQIERESINLNYRTTFVEEGVAWFAKENAAQGYTPLYRFRNVTNATYFYTASEIEKNNVVNNFSRTFVLEGVAYFVKV
jgi:lysyl endopeptidase